MPLLLKENPVKKMLKKSFFLTGWGGSNVGEDLVDVASLGGGGGCLLSGGFSNSYYLPRGGPPQRRVWNLVGLKVSGPGFRVLGLRVFRAESLES